MTIETGGPAFMAISVPSATKDYPGMNLRDWFAGQALVSMLAAPTEIRETTYDQAAQLSYKFADAMLKARGES